MRIRGLKGLWLALAVGVCATTAMSGQTTVNFGITGVGPTGNNLGGVYTDPYTGCVNCTASTAGTQVQIFCDDFTDEVNPPEYWTAFATSLGAFTGGADVTSVYFSSSVTPAGAFSGLPNNLPGVDNTKWNSGAGFSQTTDYIAAAILASQSLIAGPANAMAQNDLSFALWGLFDPTLLNSATSIYGSMDAANLLAARTDLENALVAASGYTSGADFTQKTGISATIYSQCVGCTVGQAGGSVSTSKARPQEFMTVSMPEPSFASFLFTDLAGVAVLGLVFRRRQNRKNAA